MAQSETETNETRRRGGARNQLQAKLPQDNFLPIPSCSHNVEHSIWLDIGIWGRKEERYWCYSCKKSEEDPREI